MWVTAYTDASFYDRGVAGWAYWIKCDKGRLVESGECPIQIIDNNQAEFYAIYKAIDKIVRTWDEVIGIKIVTDSKNSINSINDITNQNKITYECLFFDEIAEIVRNRNLRLNANHVKGHSGHYINTEVDRYAKRVMRLKRKENSYKQA